MKLNTLRKWQKGEHAADTKADPPSTRKRKPKEPSQGMIPVGLSLPDPFVQALLLMYPGLSGRMAERKFIIDRLQPYEGE